MTTDFTLKVRRFEPLDKRLGRHVVHDSRSLRYLAPARDPRKLASIRHHINIPIMDQGDLGSCTGHAGTAALAGDAFWSASKDAIGPGDPHVYAVHLYGDATAIDPWPGQYTPDDTGSDGLSIAKVLQARGLISGYTHATSLEATLTALAERPVIIGTSWRNSMYDPTPEGQLLITGATAGGHEFALDELDVERQRVWMRNSWSDGWGQAGRADPEDRPAAEARTSAAEARQQRRCCAHCGAHAVASLQQRRPIIFTHRGTGLDEGEGLMRERARQAKIKRPERARQRSPGLTTDLPVSEVRPMAAANSTRLVPPGVRNPRRDKFYENPCPLCGAARISPKELLGRPCAKCSRRLLAKSRKRPPLGITHHPLYAVLASMRTRCQNPNSPAYQYYGARGIYVCDEWRHRPRDFVAWAEANGYAPGLELDRIDGDGPYAPWNCQFLTHIENSRKSRWTQCTEELARAIKADLAKGHSTRAVAEAHGLSRHIVKHISCGHTWKDV